MRRFRNPFTLILEHLRTMTASIDDLKTEIANNSSVTASVQALIGNLVSELQAQRNSPDGIDALIAQLKANDAGLAQAVANVPAEDQPAPPAPPADTTTGASSDDTTNGGQSGDAAPAPATDQAQPAA